MDHCLERLCSSADIEKRCIQVTDEERGLFKVKSQDPNTQSFWYSLTFGDTATMPHCECADWEKNRLPCKHFLAVFRLFKDWGFEKLPTPYRESPFLTLDNDVLFCKESLVKNETIEVDHCTLQDNESAEDGSTEIFSELPGRKKISRTWNTKCKEAIKHLNTLTHIVDDTESLKQVHALLHQCIEIFNQASLKDDGLILEKPEKFKRISKSNSASSKSTKTNTTFKEIPKATRRNPFSGRHGSRAETMKRTFKVHVDVTWGEHVAKRPRKSPADSGVETEVVPMDLDDTGNLSIRVANHRDHSAEGVDTTVTATPDFEKAACSVSFEGNTIHSMPSVLSQSTVDEEKKKASPKRFQGRASNSVSSKGDLPEMETEKENNGRHNLKAGTSHAPSATLDIPTLEKTRESDAVVVIDDDHPDPSIWLNIDNSSPEDPQSKLVLYSESKPGILRRTYWLHDSEIYAGEILLKKAFPLIDGLNDPAQIGPLVVPAMSEFVQIINVGAHWVSLSTISCTPGVVKVYDSLYRKHNNVVIEHACRMILHAGPEVTFLYEKVQKQLGSSDCGLFALAFATDLCHGLDPTKQSYNQEMMRRHFVDCLEKGEMTPFPNTAKRVPFHLAMQKTKVPIFCICRLPYDKEEYVQCCKCHDWYHTDCVKVPEWAVNTKRKWGCRKCKDYIALKPQNILAGIIQQ